MAQPELPPLKRIYLNNKQFIYDEMVMSKDGTRYYIRYLDEELRRIQLTRNRATANGTLLGNGQTTVSRIPAMRSELYSCPFCKQVFRDRESLNTHKDKFHANAPTGPITCHPCSCGKKFLSIMYLRRHQKSHWLSTGILCGKGKVAKLPPEYDSVEVIQSGGK